MLGWVRRAALTASSWKRARKLGSAASSGWSTLTTTSRPRTRSCPRQTLVMPPDATCSLRSEERRVGKECRSRCDWSSDVCSSDLGGQLGVEHLDHDVPAEDTIVPAPDAGHAARCDLLAEIGRASCRERV